MAYPKLVTVAIIIKDNKILLIKRANEPELGKWALPSGTGAFAKYSNPEEAVKDEVAYDLNCKFYPKSFFKNYFRDNEVPVLSLIYLGTIKEEPKINPSSVQEWAYFSKQEISNMDLAFEHKKIVNDYFSQ
jgi:ADP-ribose pyrophosphatase YjhB (NUDIX family)